MTRYSFSLRRRTLLGACALSLAASLPGVAAAQSDWPNKPIRIVLPLTAGGVADANIRAIAAKMQAKLGQPVIVENKPGGSGAVAYNAARQAPADGHTLLVIHVGMLSAQALLKTFDLGANFQPIGLTGEAQLALVASGKSQISSVDDLVKRARAEPGKLNYGTIGIGSVEHLVTENLSSLANMQLTHVPYKGGPDIVQALSAGVTDIALLLPQIALPFAEKGMLRVLASLSSQRQAVMPNVPTMEELKLPVRSLTLWSGMMAPKGTPAPVLQRLHTELVAAMQDPDVRKQMQSAGSTPTFSATPAEFGTRMDADLEWIRQTIASRKISLN
ncbi:MAG: tripartite tricarboxylate transporter substrate binding protein [Burkholderiales bacterium]|nr:tripartite tricarboxylate transporter substrate binding protein [Burkholderiales bacterium]MBK8665745.1 tripartite tricarboxylate transporter substrate binding protein [Burkholderiales bacterium]